MPLQIRTRVIVGVLLMLFPKSNLAGQAPDSYRTTTRSPELPRFTIREIVTGSNDTLTRIPGAWLAAATAQDPESLAVSDYHRVAALSGLTPLEGKALASDRLQHVSGLYRRKELVEASRQTLTAIRTSISDDTTRARFDRLFHPGNEWVVDLHDAALHWSRSRAREITWSSALRALAAAHWLELSDSTALEAVPRALYGLRVLAQTDSAAFVKVNSDMARADSVSAAAVRLLLNGYAESEKWYSEALQFFLTQPWVSDKAQRRSLADYVREYWRGIEGGGAPGEVPLPELRARIFGYPQAVPHYGVPTELFQRLVVAHNSTARDWLRRYGEPALLRTLRLLPPGDTSLAFLQAGPEAIRLTTLPRHSKESLNGFLEPRDAIAIDPGYSPLLALGTVVHEWQHLLFRRQQLKAFAALLPTRSTPLLDLPGIEPYLAEGFAEWSSERILAPVRERWPLLGLGEVEKRAGLGTEDADDQHSVGYALVRALEEAVGNAQATTRLLLAHAEHPAAIARRPAMVQAWKRYARAPDRVLSIPAHRILIPEITFTVEDQYPDVIASRILVPAPGKPSR
jgi:hypothetical protein